MAFLDANLLFQREKLVKIGLIDVKPRKFKGYDLKMGQKWRFFVKIEFSKFWFTGGVTFILSSLTVHLNCLL